jgi:hypothetical protein
LISKHKEFILKSDLLNHWIDLATRQADSNGKVEERISAISFLTEIWFNFSDSVE